MLRRAKPYLGTLVEIGCVVNNADEGGEGCIRASEAGFSAVARIHQQMSRHVASSELSLLNAIPPGVWFSISSALLQVLQFSQKMATQTQGLFDIFRTGQPAIDGPGAQPFAAKGCWRDFDVDAGNCRVRKTAAIHADLDGVAKGYAVDCAVAALQKAGASRGWVNAGGDMRVFGELSLPVRIRAPWDLSTTVACTALENNSVATSASYLQAEPVLRNASTGLRLKQNYSWTVMAPNCMAADALTKIVAASNNPFHPVLAHYGARAWIFKP